MMRALFQGGPKHNTRMMLRDGLCGPLHTYEFSVIPRFHYPMMSAEDLAKPINITLRRVVYQFHHIERSPGGDVAIYGFVSARQVATW